MINRINQNFNHIYTENPTVSVGFFGARYLITASRNEEELAVLSQRLTLPALGITEQSAYTLSLQDRAWANWTLETLENAYTKTDEIIAESLWLRICECVRNLFIWLSTNQQNPPARAYTMKVPSRGVYDFNHLLDRFNWMARTEFDTLSGEKDHSTDALFDQKMISSSTGEDVCVKKEVLYQWAPPLETFSESISS